MHVHFILKREKKYFFFVEKFEFNFYNKSNQYFVQFIEMLDVPLAQTGAIVSVALSNDEGKLEYL